MNVEGGSYCETIIDSLRRLYDFVDSCLKKEDDQEDCSDEMFETPRSKRQALASIVRQIMHLIRKNDKEHEALFARNKMLENKLKNVSHLIRALDKISQIPEIPMLVKQEDSSDADITYMLETDEDKQLSMIVEITEPGNSDHVGEDSNKEQDGDDEVHPGGTNCLIQDKEQDERQVINLRQSIGILPSFNRHPLETSTPKSTGDQTGTEMMSLKYFSKPTIFEKIVKLSTNTKDIDCMSSAEKTKEEEAKPLEIENNRSLSDFNESDTTIHLHDDTVEKIYSDISSDDLFDEIVAKDESKCETRRRQSVSHESMSTIHKQTGSKFKLKEPVLNVDKLCNTEQFEHSKAKIQHALQNSETDKEQHMPRKKQKQEHDQVYEDITDVDNFSDTLSKMCNSQEHELIDLTEVDQKELTRGRRTIRFEEIKQNKDLAINKELESDLEPQDIDSVDQGNQTDTEGIGVQDNQDEKNEDNYDKESEDGANDNEVLFGEVQKNIARRRHAFWRQERGTEEGNYMEDSGAINFDVTASPVLIKEITQQDNREQNEELNIDKSTSQDIVRRPERGPTSDQTNEVDLLTINNYDSFHSDEPTLSASQNDPHDQYHADRDSNVSDETLNTSKYTRAHANTDEVGSTFCSLTSKTLAYKVSDSVNIACNSLLKLNQLQTSKENQVKTAIMPSRGTNENKTKRSGNERNKNRESDEEKNHFTHRKSPKAKENSTKGNTTLEVKDNGKLDISSYTSDDDYMDTADVEQKQIETSRREIKDIRKVQKLQMEVKSDTEENKDDNTMDSSKTEELKPKSNLRGRRRKISVSESEVSEDDIVNKKYPKRQASKTRLTTDQSDRDEEQKRERPKRICAKPKKIEENEQEKNEILNLKKSKEKKETLSQTKPKVMNTRTRSKKRTTKRSDA